MTKLRKLQRACSLGDFFEAREVTHDIFLSQIKMGLGSPVKAQWEMEKTGSRKGRGGGWSNESPDLGSHFRSLILPFPHPHPGQCCHSNLAKPTRSASLFSLLCQAVPALDPLGPQTHGQEGTPRKRRAGCAGPATTRTAPRAPEGRPAPSLLGRRCPPRWGKGGEGSRRASRSREGSRPRTPSRVPEGEARRQERPWLRTPPLATRRS